MNTIANIFFFLIVNLSWFVSGAQSKIETNFENPFSKLKNKETWSGYKDKGADHLRSEYGPKIKPVPELSFIEVDLPKNSLQDMVQGFEAKNQVKVDTAAIIDSLSNKYEIDSLDLPIQLDYRLDSSSVTRVHEMDSLLRGDSLIQRLSNKVKIDTTQLMDKMDLSPDSLDLPKQPEHELVARFRKESFLDAYKDHFSEYQPLLKKSQGAIEKYKKKESFKSFIKELFSNKLSNSDSSGGYQRFEMGTFFELKKGPFSIVCNPALKLNVTDKLAVGLGYSFDVGFGPVKIDNVLFRAFTQYRFRKYFIHLEAESKKSVDLKGESFKVIPSGYNYSIGMGRKLQFGKVGGSLLLLYHLKEPEGKKLSLRYNINIL